MVGRSFAVCLVAAVAVIAADVPNPQILELSTGESREIRLPSGTAHRIGLIALDERTEPYYESANKSTIEAVVEATARLSIDDGVAVDASLRTSAPDVYAAGDVAAAEHPILGMRIRVEHWANALNGGPVAARSMLGQDVVYDELPYFFTDQYDLGMEYIGHAPPGSYDRVVVRGDLAGREFQAFWLSGGRALAGMHVNLWDDGIDPIKEVVASGRVLDPDRLADPAVPLGDA